MVKILGSTAEELAEVQDIIIRGLIAKGDPEKGDYVFNGSFELTSGNVLVTDGSIWHRIIGEREDSIWGASCTRYI